MPDSRSDADYDERKSGKKFEERSPAVISIQIWIRRLHRYFILPAYDYRPTIVLYFSFVDGEIPTDPAGIRHGFIQKVFGMYYSLIDVFRCVMTGSNEERVKLLAT